MGAVQLGERIPNTQLVRRFEKGREIPPLFIPDDRDTQAVENGCQEAARAGRRSVEIYGTLYVSFDGQWYAWDHLGFDKVSRSANDLSRPGSANVDTRK